MDLERRSLPVVSAGLKIERRSETEQLLSGYAAVFWNPQERDATQFRLWSNCYERILPGAFDDALREKDDVRCLFNHNDSLILGRTPDTLTLSVDARGLRYDCLLPATTVGNDLRVSMERKDVRESSFGFNLRGSSTDQEWTEEEVELPGGQKVMIEVRLVRRVRLYDVSPVTFPAYKGTSSEIAQRSHKSWQEAKPRRIERINRRLRLLD